LVLKDSFNNKEIYLIERYKSNNKIHGFFLGAGSKYHCFKYETGFDEFVRHGDRLSKKNGELSIKVTKKTKEARTFTFEISNCEINNAEIFSLIYVEAH
jgi:hypothetical protein